jgi:hypothetical protein
VRRSDAEGYHKGDDTRNSDCRASDRAAKKFVFNRPPISQLITAPTSGAKIIRLKKLFSVILYNKNVLNSQSALVVDQQEFVFLCRFGKILLNLSCSIPLMNFQFAPLSLEIPTIELSENGSALRRFRRHRNRNKCEQIVLNFSICLIFPNFTDSISKPSAFNRAESLFKKAIVLSRPPVLSTISGKCNHTSLVKYT